MDFTAAISRLEELKLAHRSGQWAVLPDRYAAVRKLLITIRTSNSDLTAKQQTAIQQALANLRSYETSVEKGLVSDWGAAQSCEVECNPASRHR